ncbi:MAG: hypothetical protein R3320_00695, partial [Nitriliruptorales bacterium]|nr:hypothetical protein [Nitriliruptorales bacterium]
MRIQAFHHRVTGLVLGLTLVVLIGTGCSEAANDTVGAGGPGAGEPAPAETADRTIQVLARDDLSFAPHEVDVAVGEVVTFEVTNHGATAHEF